MNLNDFNRYAKDFEKPATRTTSKINIQARGSGLSFLQSELAQSRQAQMMRLNQQSQLANMRLRQQSMTGFGLNQLGQIVKLK